MIMSYTYPAFIAYDPGTNTFAINAVGNVYDPADTAFANPLEVTDLSGNSITDLSSNQLGIVTGFISDIGAAVWKSPGYPGISLGSNEMYAAAAAASQAASEAAQTAAEAAQAAAEEAEQNSIAPTTQAIDQALASGEHNLGGTWDFSTAQVTGLSNVSVTDAGDYLVFHIG